MDIYKLKQKDYSNKVAYVRNEEWSTNDTYEILCGKYKLIEPIQVKHLSGSKWNDFLSPIDVNIPVVSKRVVELFNFYQFTGWRAGELSIIHTNVPNFLEYNLLMIEGRVGLSINDIKKGEIRLLNYPDFFLIDGLSAIFVSKKVYEVLSSRKNKVTNVDFVTFSDYLNNIIPFL